MSRCEASGVSQHSKLCSTNGMNAVARPDWWCYPAQCSAGHPWAPGRITVGWMPCDCPNARAHEVLGHLWVRCRANGCPSIWYRPRHEPATTGAGSVSGPLADCTALARPRGRLLPPPCRQAHTGTVGPLRVAGLDGLPVGGLSSDSDLGPSAMHAIKPGDWRAMTSHRRASPVGRVRRYREWRPPRRPPLRGSSRSERPGRVEWHAATARRRCQALARRVLRTVST